MKPPAQEKQYELPSTKRGHPPTMPPKVHLSYRAPDVGPVKSDESGRPFYSAQVVSASVARMKRSVIRENVLSYRRDHTLGGTYFYSYLMKDRMPIIASNILPENWGGKSMDGSFGE